MNWIEYASHEPFVCLAAAAIFLVLAISGYIFVLTRTERITERREEQLVGDFPRVPEGHVDMGLAGRARLEAEFAQGRN